MGRLAADGALVRARLRSRLALPDFLAGTVVVHVPEDLIRGG